MIKKKITFIYMDSAEKAIMEAIADEAYKRGYEVNMTTDKFAKCEIGVYCQHVNFPQYSKFSVIMLHDIIQQYGNWPDLWLREPWNKYDIGILPSDQWVENWNKCSQFYYTRPRRGVYKIGWPKADSVANIEREQYKKVFYAKHGLDLDKRTILYAPAWENDHKQDDFVKAMLGLNVNILIKQYNATLEMSPGQYANIQEMYKLHKDIEGVTILDPSMNIFEAIIASDVLVSEESSTMAEAIMMGIPAVSVSDWLIPDVTPSRFPECNYDFAIMTKKDRLRDCVAQIVGDYNSYKKMAEKSRDSVFCNIGKSSRMIMDIIDDCVEGKKIRYTELVPKKRKNLSIKQYIRHIGIVLNREVTQNYGIRHPFVQKIWNMFRTIKKCIYEKPLDQ